MVEWGKQDTPVTSGTDDVLAPPEIERPQSGLALQEPQGSIEEQVKEQFSVAADRGVSLGEAEALIREKGFRQSVTDALKTGTIRAAAAVANLPEHLIRAAERIGEKTREAPYSARAGIRGFAPVSLVGYFGIENTEQEEQFLQSVSVKSPNSPMSKILDHSTRWAEKGLKKVLETHPEWQNEKADSFMGLLSSPTKLASTIAESVPMLVGAGVLAGTGHPYAAFSMVYAIEGEEAYDEAIASGATEDEALEAKVLYGTVAAGLEMVQLHQGIAVAKGAWNGIRNRMVKQAVTAGVKKGGQSFTKQFLTTIAKENIEEWAQGIWQEATANMVYGKEPEGGLEGFVDRRLQESLVITALTATTAGVGGAAGAVAKKAAPPAAKAAKAPEPAAEPITPTKTAQAIDKLVPKAEGAVEGKPVWSQMVYRGLSPTGKPADAGNWGKGTYYTTKKAIAEQYARRAGIGEETGPVTKHSIALNNPIYVPNAMRSTIRATAKGLGVKADPVFEGDLGYNQVSETFAKEFREKAVAAGYDGLVVGEGEEVVVFAEQPARPAKAPAEAAEPLPAAPELEQSNKELLDWSQTAKKLRKEEVEPAVAALRKRQAGRGTGILQKELRKGQPAWDSLERSIGGYKDEAAIPDVEPPKLTPEQWEGYAQKILQVYPETDTGVQFQRTETQAAFKQLRNGKIPTNREFELLEKILGRETTEKIAENLASLRKFSGWDIPKFIIQMFKSPFTLDVQFARQASSFQARQPVEYTKGIKTSLKAYKSEQFTNEVLDAVEANPNHQDAVEHGLNFLSKAIYSAHRPEQFALGFQEKVAVVGEKPGKFLQKIVALLKPIAGEKAEPIVRKSLAGFRGYGRLMLASERSMVASCNQFLQTMWDKQLEIWSHDKQMTPQKLETLKKEYAKTLNTFIKLLRTRHPQGRRLQEALNYLLFSPSMTFSRPLRIKALIANEGSRGYAAQLVATEIGKIMLISWVAALVGNWWRHRRPDEEPPIDSDINPLMSNWGKIKVGDTYFDFMGGDAQFYRTLARAAVGAYVKANQEITGEPGPTRVGEWRVRPLTETLLTYGRTRETAAIGFGRDLWTGTDFFGNPVNRAEIVLRGFTPEIADATYDALRANGVLAALGAAGATGFSAGVQTYEKSAYSKRTDERNKLAQTYFEQDWDDLTPKEQTELKPHLEELDLAVAQERKDRPLVEKFPTAEEVETGKRIYEAMPKEIQRELFEAGVTGISLDRRRGDFYLNDRRYARYQEIAIPLMENSLHKLFRSWSYRRARKLDDKKKKIKTTLKSARDEAYKKLENQMKSYQI
jgi:hypothetical protein